MYALLTKATALEPISPAELESVTKKRQKIISRISRLAREGNFRQQVLNAYGNRCAVTRMQLRLVEAAHILPVGAEGSTDNIQNGLALSPTYHRAFDKGLIYLDDNLVMKINPQKELQLVTLSLDGGLPDFKGFLSNRIHLPYDKRQWPEPKIIRKANEYRRIHI
jgi:putative restriction endonuclease